MAPLGALRAQSRGHPARIAGRLPRPLHNLLYRFPSPFYAAPLLSFPTGHGFRQLQEDFETLYFREEEMQAVRARPEGLQPRGDLGGDRGAGRRRLRQSLQGNGAGNFCALFGTNWERVVSIIEFRTSLPAAQHTHIHSLDAPPAPSVSLKLFTAQTLRDILSGTDIVAGCLISCSVALLPSSS